MKMRGHWRKNSCWICVLLLVLCAVVGIAGYWMERHYRNSEGLGAVMAATEEKQRLVIGAEMDESATFHTLYEDGDGGEFACLGLHNVTIEIGEETLELASALQNGRISSEEIAAYARMDARNGFASETAKSQNSLTRFTYHYPSFDLCYIYDVYETPNGKNPLICKICLCAPGHEPSYLFMDEDSGMPVDYEDWGLDVAVVSVSPTAITVDCTQSGGQQVGQLVLKSYDIYLRREDGGEEFVEPVADVPFEAITLNRETVTQITLMLKAPYGRLPQGDYRLYLVLEDQYADAQLHPLMRKYYHVQRLAVEVTNP